MLLRTCSYSDGLDAAQGLLWEQRVQAQKLAASDWDALQEAGFRPPKKDDLIAAMPAAQKAGVTAYEQWLGTAVAEHSGRQVRRRDIASLDHTNLVSSAAIDTYLHLLQRRSREAPPECKYLRVLALNAEFYTKVRSGDYDGAKRMIPRKERAGVLEQDRLLVPILTEARGADHWVLAVIAPRERQLSIFNSMCSGSTTMLEPLRKWLVQEHPGTTPKNFGVGVPAAVGPDGEVPLPQQTNGVDCGVFVCQYANSVTAGRWPDWAQEDIGYIRQRMGLELLEGRIPVPP